MDRGKLGMSGEFPTHPTPLTHTSPPIQSEDNKISHVGLMNDNIEVNDFFEFSWRESILSWLLFIKEKVIDV